MLIPGTAKVNARFRTTHSPICEASCSTPRYRATRNVAAMIPYTAPDAPTVS